MSPRAYTVFCSSVIVEAEAEAEVEDGAVARRGGVFAAGAGFRAVVLGAAAAGGAGFGVAEADGGWVAGLWDIRVSRANR